MIKLHSLFFTQYPEGFYNIEVRSYFWLTLQWLTISLNSSLNSLQTWSVGHLPKSQTHLALSLAFTYYPDLLSTTDLHVWLVHLKTVDFAELRIPYSQTFPWLCFMPVRSHLKCHVVREGLRDPADYSDATHPSALDCICQHCFP